MINLKVSVTSKRVDQTIHVVCGSQVPIRLTLTDYTIPDGSTVTAYCVTSIGDLHETPCRYSGNSITFTPPEGFFTAGVNHLQIVTSDAITFIITAVADDNLSYGSPTASVTVPSYTQRAEAAASRAEAAALRAESIVGSGGTGTAMSSSVISQIIQEVF